MLTGFPWSNHSITWLAVKLHFCAWCKPLSHSSPSGPNSSILIEQGVVTRQSLLPGPQWHNRSHVGVVANITFSYRVKCQQNYYGDSCTTLCIPRDDHLGHYSCDSDGSKVCNLGWSGSYCDTGKCCCFCYLTLPFFVFFDRFSCLVSLSVFNSSPIWVDRE